MTQRSPDGSPDGSPHGSPEGRPDAAGSVSAPAGRVPALPLVTARLRLRAFRPDDLEPLLAFHSRPDVVRYVPFGPRSREGMAETLARKLGSGALGADGDLLELAVTLPDDTLVGDVLLAQRSVEHGTVEVGYLFAPEHGGQGYATEAVRALLDLAFDELGARRVVARVDARNHASRALCRRLGLRQEAYLVENEWFKGEWADEVDHAVLAREWEARRRRGGTVRDRPAPAVRARALLALHTDPAVLVLANVWDVASARAVAATDGVRALATASHALAASFGHEDGERIALDVHLDMVGRIVAAVDLPVTMDLEAGYGDPGATARRAIALGVVGGNLEDGRAPLDDAVSAVRAVLDAGRAAGVDFVLNARTDVVLLAPPGADRDGLLREAVARCRAYLAAGAPVVFVPGVTDRDEVAALVAALGPGRVSLLLVPGESPSVRELADLGVARVSTGPALQRVALRAVQAATSALLAGGSLGPPAP